MRPFLLCVHDATPAYARETRVLIRELAPLVGRRFSFGVVPDWRGQWPLAGHPDYCELVQEASEELLLHGWLHRRRQGGGPVSWLAEGSDELNGLNAEETRRTVASGQRSFTAAFGRPARGFLAPAWQAGQVRAANDVAQGPEFVVGFFSIHSSTRRVPLATWNWDCGRWGELGHLGHGLGWLLQSLNRGVPALAIHPRDLERGFWPRILRVIRDLLDRGYQPSTSADLLEAHGAEAAV
jgi:peptidoglycan/xylan/chitin deacetylase (PgdA/CDA1 family)